jgi:hypothetical protein
LLVSPVFGATPLAVGLPPALLTMPPDVPPVVLPFIEPPVVVLLAAGPPAAELPPAELPVCANAAVPDRTSIEANTSAVVFMFGSSEKLFFFFLRDKNTTPSVRFHRRRISAAMVSDSDNSFILQVEFQRAVTRLSSPHATRRKLTGLS